MAKPRRTQDLSSSILHAIELIICIVSFGELCINSTLCHFIGLFHRPQPARLLECQSLLQALAHFSQVSNSLDAKRSRLDSATKVLYPCHTHAIRA
jgi:hypothetical protein